MTKYTHVFSFYLIGGFLFALDRILKYLAYTNQYTHFLFLNNYIGWEYYANPGIAFSLPVSQTILLLITPLLLIWLYKYIKPTNNLAKFGLLLIILGASSNYIDRILFNITIDYLRLYTSIFNIADIMVLSGIIITLKTTT